jgi:hypothetical protein
MPGIRETIFRRLLYHEKMTESALIECCASGNGRITNILNDLERDGYLVSFCPEPGKKQTSSLYRINRNQDMLYRMWLENPDLRPEIQNTPWVQDVLAQERLRISDDKLRAEVCAMLRQSGLFFELTLKHRQIAGIIANWDRIVNEPGFELDSEDILVNDEIIPAYKYYAFFGFCVFYDCLTTENPGERVRFLRSVQENTPTLMAVTKIISLLK